LSLTTCISSRIYEISPMFFSLRKSHSAHNILPDIFRTDCGTDSPQNKKLRLCIETKFFRGSTLIKESFLSLNLHVTYARRPPLLFHGGGSRTHFTYLPVPGKLT